MDQKLRKALSVVLALVFLFSVGKLVGQYMDSREAEAADRLAQELLEQAQTQPETQEIQETQPPETAAPETEPPEPEYIWVPAEVEQDQYMETLSQKDLDALRQENPDVVGWIWIPGTYINYPLMQGTDNQYYLKHTWNNTASTHGSIFLECQNSRDLSDFNTIIYGHNMADKTMFATVVHYAGAYYQQMYPYVYIATDSGVYRYEVFSAYKASVDSITYQLSFNQQESREAFIQAALENALYDTGIQPATTDRIITLSTCTGWGNYDQRWVVHARLAMVEVELQ